ncbi:MAG: hypothetical protein J6W16_03415, partial [Methanobrevibacter sp.]|nr:hypothetical protein [Methanobrevibacter sp.]
GLLQCYDIPDAKNNAKHMDGIILVSHKLKMLSFIYLCYDVKYDKYDPMLLYTSFNSNIVKWKRWYANVLSESKSIEWLALVPNECFAKYSIAFYNARFDVDIYPYEICFNAEEHHKNELFRENIDVDIRVSQIEEHIERCNEKMRNIQNEIRDFNNNIDELKDGLEDYADKLYISRIDSDLR